MIVHWHDGENELDCKCPASDLFPDEEAIVARFEAAEPAPESYVRQHRSEADCKCPASDLFPDEQEIVARFEAAEAAPESYVRQHRSEESCWCSPRQVGTLGVWTHRVVEP